MVECTDQEKEGVGHTDMTFYIENIEGDKCKWWGKVD